MTHVLQVIFLSVFILQVVMHGEESQVPGDLNRQKRKFLYIENWTDAFAIFSSVLRNVNPNHPTLAEYLAIDADLIRQIQKDCGDWYFNDVNFRQTLQNYDTLSWSYADQILHARALNRNITTVIKELRSELFCHLPVQVN